MLNLLCFPHKLSVVCGSVALMITLTHQAQAACGTTITWTANANTTTNWNPVNVPNVNTETAFIISD